jgi:hypothetical protein
MTAYATSNTEIRTAHLSVAQALKEATGAPLYPNQNHDQVSTPHLRESL